MMPERPYRALHEASRYAAERLLGIGIYTIPEAVRLTRVSAGRIRRWVAGYEWSTVAAKRHSPPVWRPDIEALDGSIALSFRDLQEIRFVDAFLNAGVSWKKLRAIGEKASRRYGTTHPFSTRDFLTDGVTIYDEEMRRDREMSLEDLHEGQFAFHRIMAPSLRHGLEFAPSGAVVRWWPEAGATATSRIVVVDPERSFGQPIIAAKNVPTGIIAAAIAVEPPDAESRVAEWFGTSIAAVRAAVRFEAQLSEPVAAA